MKRLINKLFEKLGYVPIKKVLRYILIEREIQLKGVSYHCYIGYYCYEVKARTNYGETIIKVYPYHDADTQDYARICAEELCEMLNEKY